MFWREFKKQTLYQANHVNDALIHMHLLVRAAIDVFGVDSSAEIKSNAVIVYLNWASGKLASKTELK